MVVGVEAVIGLNWDHGRAEAPGIAHQGAGLDAECLGRVAGGDSDGGIRERLDDDHGLAAQGRGLLLLARRKERIEIEEQPLDGVVGRWRVHFLFYTLGGRYQQARPCRRATPSASKTWASSTWCAPAATPAGTRRSFQTLSCYRGDPATRASWRLSASCTAANAGRGARPCSMWNSGRAIEFRI